MNRTKTIHTNYDFLWWNPMTWWLTHSYKTTENSRVTIKVRWRYTIILTDNPSIRSRFHDHSPKIT